MVPTMRNILAFLCLAKSSHSDIYLYSPRGSNNRLYESTTTVNNPNRLFWSNNDLRGGVNIGVTNQEKAERNPKSSDQYRETYFASGGQGSTYKTVQFAIDKGCGPDEDGEYTHECKVVLQGSCQPAVSLEDSSGDKLGNDLVTFRDGTATMQRKVKHDFSTIQNPNGLCYQIAPGSLKEVPILRLPRKTHELPTCKNFCTKNKKPFAILAEKHCYCVDYLVRAHNPAMTKNLRKRLFYEGKSFTMMNMAGNQNFCSTCRWQSSEKCGTWKKVVTWGKWGRGSKGQTQNADRMNEFLAAGFFVTVHKSGYSDSLPPESRNAKNARKAYSTSAKNPDQKNLGLHESWEAYDACPTKSEYQPKTFEKKNSGFECKHERENHPIKYASMWHDIAIFGDSKVCDFTPMNIYECVEFYPGTENGFRKHKSIYRNQKSCEANKGKWTQFWHFIDRAKDRKSKSRCEEQTPIKGLTFKWGRPLDYQQIGQDILAQEECLVLPPKPVCNENLVGGKLNTRANIFSMNGGTNDFPSFKWRIPQFYNQKEDKTCVLRIRHFVYHAKRATTTQILHAVNQKVNIDEASKKFIFLALPETPQSSTQVYQDRSHLITIQPRHGSHKIPNDLTINTIDVRGKRGNIVQTFPSTEYDFVPTITKIPNNQAIQFQWTGSNDHRNGNSPNNDGQSGDAGNGRSGTDRNNVLQISDHKHNYPVPFEVGTLFRGAKFIWAPREANFSSTFLTKQKTQSQKEYSAFISHASSGYYFCQNLGECQTGFETRGNRAKGRSLKNLDNVPPSFRGMVFIPKNNKVFHFASTRNNDFSNRSQKGSIVVGNCHMGDDVCMELFSGE